MLRTFPTFLSTLLLLAAPLLAAPLLAGCERKPAEPATNRSGDDRVTQATPSNETKPTHNLVLRGAFQSGLGDPGGLPEDAPQRALAKIDITQELAGSLNEQKQMIVDQVLERNAIVPADEIDPDLPTLVIEFGDAVKADPKRPMTHSGLLVRVDLQRAVGHRAASRQIPPADNGGELIANLDHTLDTLVTMATEQPE